MVHNILNIIYSTLSNRTTVLCFLYSMLVTLIWKLSRFAGCNNTCLICFLLIYCQKAFKSFPLVQPDACEDLLSIQVIWINLIWSPWQNSFWSTTGPVNPLASLCNQKSKGSWLNFKSLMKRCCLIRINNYGNKCHHRPRGCFLRLRNEVEDTIRLQQWGRWHHRDLWNALIRMKDVCCFGDFEW